MSVIGSSLRSWFGSIIVRFAEWTGGATAGKPRVNAGCVIGMSTGQSSNVIVVLDRVQADGTRVSRIGKQFSGKGVLDMIVIIMVIIVQGMCLSSRGFLGLLQLLCTRFLVFDLGGRALGDDCYLV